MQWQPIETAPRDGTVVLLWIEAEPAGPALGRWMRLAIGKKGTGWFGYGMHSEPTHWAPIEPPQEGK